MNSPDELRWVGVLLMLSFLLWSWDTSVAQGSPDTSSLVIEHQLTVAANPVLFLTDAEVDKILAQVNTLMHGKKYAWDTACPDVTFVRKGDVITDSGLLVTGTYEQLAANLREIAPQATTLVVTSIKCNGIQAAGCGPIGQEPMVVGQYPGYENQLWAHERGHNVGLPHSAEFPTLETAVTEDIALRFMFWRLGLGHLGKSAFECTQFETSSLPSVDRRATSMGGATLAVSEVGTGPEAGALPLPVVTMQQDNERELTAAAKSAGLTTAAFRVVGPPWVENIPVDEIKALKNEDLDSIRAMLKGSPNEYWPQGLSALAIAGTSEDVALVKRALELPAPAIAPNAQLDQAQIDQFRLLMRIKLSAPGALGILANRTNSTAAVETLKNSARLDVAAKLIGSATATTLSKTSLEALVLSNSNVARSFIDKVIKSSAEGKSSSGGANVAPLSRDEALKLKAKEAAIRQNGIEAYIRTGDTG